MMIPRKNKKPFTLLEVMIVIAIVAIIGGGLFWRLSKLVETHRKQSDVARLQSVLWSSRMLAINRKTDFVLEIVENKGGWALRLISLEDPALQYGCGQLSNVPMEGPLRFTFYSTGHVAPSGTLLCGKTQIKIPAFFHQEEGEVLGPIHPDELKNK